MAREVLLTLTGLSLDESGQETVTRQTVKAQYAFREGRHFFRYEEQEDPASSPTLCLLKLQEGYLELSKKGAVYTRMVFENGKEHRTDYVTPFGNLWLGICTHRAGFTHLPAGADPVFLQYVIQYTLALEGQPLGEYTMTLQAVSA